ncbi:uncharacterized protein LOC108029456 [Drosophila biarmipes]|uniref:uncharacterized protein LOC108029456 n=1 Tax=Drosophila biarmipes TaxID=125945 RepID=UPI0007E7AC1C|nr:uncharacterized protein LOC108029456 [Drosophila biarmipes]
MAKKTNNKLSESDLDIGHDLAFVDSLLGDLQLEAEPETRGVILNLAYTLAREKLEEAQRFAKLANRSNVSVEDLEMAKLQKTRKLRKTEEPSKRSMKLLAKHTSQDAALPLPRSDEGGMLPTWRSCQIGVKGILKDKSAQPPKPKRRMTKPDKTEAATPSTSATATPSRRSTCTAAAPSKPNPT